MRIYGRMWIFLGLVSCGSNSSGTTVNGGSDGVVPADLRDVERDGEGLVATTFGEYPRRAADWQRATSILSLLDQVWSRSKQGNPSLSAKAVKSVDDAIAVERTAIASMDQQAASLAANQVGLAVPDLFALFRPDAPIEIVRMDAVFRQLGLDSHFGRAADLDADIKSLTTDWSNIKTKVSLRVPTCHRVGGTATVVGDIEQSLGNLNAVSSTPDQTTIEKESENGALEIDTLELLFDCPPDSAAPTTGLGARCTTTSQCDPGQVCDRTNSGGTCAPDPSNRIGTPCVTTTDCGTDSRAACQTEAGDNFKGGYCFMEPCNDIEVCPPGSTCVSLGGETPGCFKACSSDGDCRQAEGYVCQLFVTTPPVGFGPTDHACVFPCTRDTDCHSPLQCDVASGKCTP